jgi:GTP-binding protein YchF
VNISLFGCPKAGKTTLFNILTGARLSVHAYEDGKHGANARTCHVPDERLDRLHALSPEKRRVPVAFDLADLAGLAYAEARKADGLVHVVRGFRDPDVPHARPRVDPAADIVYMEEELVIADLGLVTGRLEKLEKDLKKMRDPEGEKERDILERLHPHLEAGRPARDLEMPAADEKLVRSFALLTLRPLLAMVNLDDSDAAFAADPSRFAPGDGRLRPLLAFCGRIEAELLELGDDERREFMAAYGLSGPAAARFFDRILEVMGRVTFYTSGKDEVRAWAVPAGTPAQKAAGAIHSDIEKGFIRAEVITWEALLRHGSLPKAKEAGAIRLEGKDYLVRDGDVVYFRFAS